MNGFRTVRAAVIGVAIAGFALSANAQGWAGGIGGAGQALQEISNARINANLQNELAQRQAQRDLQMQLALMRQQAAIELQRIQLEFDLEQRRRSDILRRQQEDALARNEADRLSQEQSATEQARVAKEANDRRIAVEWAKVTRAHPDADALIASERFATWSAKQTGETRTRLNSSRGEDLAIVISSYKKQLKSRRT